MDMLTQRFAEQYIKTLYKILALTDALALISNVYILEMDVFLLGFLCKQIRSTRKTNAKRWWAGGTKTEK